MNETDLQKIQSALAAIRMNIQIGYRSGPAGYGHLKMAWIDTGKLQQEIKELQDQLIEMREGETHNADTL